MKSAGGVAALAIAVLLVPEAAAAADQAPPSVAAPDVRNWGGFYAGVALGAKWGDIGWTTTAIGDPPAAAGVVDASSPHTFSPVGARVGGFLGYNRQAGPWVYGVEFDIAYANASRSSTGIPGCAIECAAGFPGPGNDSASVAMTWDASARLRLGYLLRPDLLVFGTGGVAWQRVEASATCENVLSDPACLVSPPFSSKTQTNATTRTGWTIGVGADWALAPQWRLRGEYRYADYGTWRDVFFAGQPVADPGADAIHYDLKVRTHLLTVGLAYRLD